MLLNYADEIIEVNCWSAMCNFDFGFRYGLGMWGVWLGQALFNRIHFHVPFLVGGYHYLLLFLSFSPEKNVKSDSAAAMFSFPSVVFNWLDRNSNLRNGLSLTLQFSRSDTVFLHMNEYCAGFIISLFSKNRHIYPFGLISQFYDY